MSIRIKVDSEVEGIESIVPFAKSLVKKAKICVFISKILQILKNNLCMICKIIKLVVQSLTIAIVFELIYYTNGHF